MEIMVGTVPPKNDQCESSDTQEINQTEKVCLSFFSAHWIVGHYRSQGEITVGTGFELKWTRATTGGRVLGSPFNFLRIW